MLPSPDVEACARRTSRRRGLVALLLAAGGGSSCFIVDKAQVGVDRVSVERVDRELNESALTGPRPSSSSLEVLHFFDLQERFDDEPEAALVELHRALCADPQRRFLHAIAELCYLRGKELKSRDHFLAAAVYAYLYLLGEEELPPANAYDRRFRWACDLYNRGLREAFLAPTGRELVLEPGRRTLPTGILHLTLDPAHMPFEGLNCSYLPADDYSVWGLSVRLRDSGLGAPLIASVEDLHAGEAQARFHGEHSNVPATLFLRLQGGLADLEQGLAGSLELYSSSGAQEVEVAGREVPLESDFSAALALGLDRSKIWGLSTRGFFGGESHTGLYLVRPYERGLVPVVFVHGTASNPANWAEMFNMLQVDHEIRQRVQFWFFLYATGNPISVSAAKLRASLQDALATLDPEGTDDALRQMVVVGHSQGGLLTKLMAVDGDMSWLQELVGTSLEELDLSEEQQKLLRSALDFDPLPFVQRVIFLSTPHGGSFLADRRFARFINKLIALPGELTGFTDALLRNEAKLPAGIEARIPTSLDNMKESNKFLQVLQRAPLAPWITAHSIIAIKDADPAHPQGADDGVVEYESAHIEGVESEFLVGCGHSCQSNPRAIREVRRILLEHLASLPSDGADSALGEAGR